MYMLGFDGVSINSGQNFSMLNLVILAAFLIVGYNQSLYSF